ncbi:MAG: DUF7146 domain-containing protein [Hyphomicrobium sp.]
MTAPTLPEIKSMLQVNIEALARQLAPEGRRSGRWWLAKNPRREDNNPSFGIGLGGTAPGAWTDFATGDKGDVFGLIQYVHGLEFKDALAWARSWLGIEGAAPVAVATRLRDAKANAEARAREEQERAAKNRKHAFGLYLAGRKRAFVPSPAHTYLCSRGIDVTRLGKMPGCLGWVPDMRHVETDTKWPAMIAAFFNADGAVVAVHRTYLRPDGAGKAPVTPARKIWPSYKGAAIYLWRGKSKLSASEASANGLLETLVLVEGVEDGLSVALACPDFRVWAAGSLANLGEITLPKCCDEVVVCADNDWGKPQAQALLDRAVEGLAAQGVTVRVARSTVGKDVNDALRG